MPIYTKTGDQGTTGLLGGQRLSKAATRVEAQGTVDELNAALGLAASISLSLKITLAPIQSALFTLGAELAAPDPSHLGNLVLISQADIDALEQAIDDWQLELPPLANFILPGGSSAGAALHLGRTVCRRAERRLVELATAENLRPELLKFINRLSDYLFVLARWTNFKESCAETKWNSQ